MANKLSKKQRELVRNLFGTTVYLVGETVEFTDSEWYTANFIGIFSTREKAEEACRSMDHFVMRFTLDEANHGPAIVEKGESWYPLAEKLEALG